MEIEQRPPNQPNFLLVVILFGVALIVIFILAWLFIRFDGKHLTFRHHPAHPTSQLILPAPSTSAQLSDPTRRSPATAPIC
ncbi:MAG TPA: hypothetical protein VK814_01100 [Acidobacteriaceae bacterium]|jgi:hypothetical protein|nr:hypothetical protein [Acidobacteriaceae bacterium]